MGLYDALKDAIRVAQKANNIDLYRQLQDLSVQALDMQAEIAKLKEENKELKKKKNVARQIVRHEEPCITLKNDDKHLYYCSHCWDSQQLLIQVNCHENGTFDCPHCSAKGNYDNQKKKQSDIAIARAMQERQRSRRAVFR